MSLTLAEVREYALQLSPQDRASLLEELEGSLADGSLAEVESAWADEIAKRVASIHDGSSVGIPAEELMVAKRPGVCGGEACLAGTRIPVWVLEQARRLGAPEAQLLHSYPSITREQLVVAWAYAATHRPEIDEAIRDNEED